MLLLALVSASPQLASGQAATPAEIVARLQNEILTIDRQFPSGTNDAKTFSRRLAAIQPLIEDTHDLAYMAQLTLKTQWSSLDDEQRTLFITTFSELSVMSYATRFRDLAGVGFRRLAERELPRGRAEVQTELIEADGSIVALNYLLHKTADGWAIINVLADGVSELALKRSQYRSILNKQDFAALLRYVEQQKTDLGTEAIDGSGQ
jgi:phospholipid transport system substrate-binding protein